MYRERAAGKPAALLKEEFYEKISKIRNWQFISRFRNIFCPSTYDLSIVVKCEKNVFKSPQKCEQIVKFRDNSYKF